MEKSNEKRLIGELYYFLKENEFIPRDKEIEKIEVRLFRELEQLRKKEFLSETEFNEFEEVCERALIENEINGFIAGLYIVNKLKNEIKFNRK